MKTPHRSLLSKALLIACLVQAAEFAALGTDVGSLRVGAARVDITPPADPANPPLGKYAHERLYVRAIVLDNGVTRAAVIGADQSGLGEATWVQASKLVADELKCPVENIIMSATHTHSPGVPIGPQNASPAIVNSIVEAVRQARMKLQPARVTFGTGLAYLNVNRDVVNPKTHLWTQDSNPQAPSDKTVGVMRFETPEGRPIAIYVNYAMHPINLYLGGITSADFPGATSRYIERIYGDDVVVAFSQGTSGDQNPLYLRPSTVAMLRRGDHVYNGEPLTREAIEAPLRDGGAPMTPLNPKDAEDIERWIETEGMILGEEVMRVMENSAPATGDVRLWGGQKMVTCPGRIRTNIGREGQPGEYKDGPDVPIRLSVLGIGGNALAAIDAEVYTPIGLGVKHNSPLANTLVVTLANGAAPSGYIPSDDAFGRYTFQVLGSKLRQGCAEHAIEDGLVDLLNNYVK